MSKPKVQLLVPTIGGNVRDVIEVENKAEADRLVANGTARRVTAAQSKKD